MPVLSSGNNITISISAGYTIVGVALVVDQASSRKTITATNGTLTAPTPSQGDVTTVQNVNNSSTTLSTSGNYRFEWMTVYYTPIDYTITYNLNNGSVSGNPTSYNIETNTFTLKNPTRSGYTFTGWTGSNGNTKQTSVSIAKGSTGNKSYTANWQVNQASVTTAPTAKTGLTYNGSAKALVNAGVASNGTMHYKIGTSGSWSTSIPTATNAGSYTVQYYAKGTGGASDSGTGSVQVTIAKANPTVTAPTAKTGLKYTGSAQALVNAGSTTGGTMQYKVGSGSWDTSIPTGTDVGTYTVYYQVASSANYNGNNGSNFQVTIAQSDQQKADAVIAQINAIGSPITAASQSAITSARTAYNALTAEQKALVTNYTTLTNAEAALAVVNLINAIGSPITAASQTAIEDARNAYDNLTDDQKALVGNLSALTDAEAALAVVNQIAAIGEVTLSSGSTIADVRTAYDALTGDQQALVGNYSTLTAAEAAYNTLVADHAAADAVIAQINAIGSPITAADQTAIEDARAAYDALTDTQKGYVTNYSELTDAESALAVVNLINAIDDPVVYTNECHQEILDARAAYDALSDEQKALVDATTLQVLTDAEAAYATLVDDHAAADAVITLINAIDDPVVYTDACHQEILDAREAYNNLTQAQKDLIDASTLQKLTDAEDAYASLNVDITAKLDPVNAGVYYSTFYDGSRQLQLPANVEAYTATVSGDKMLLKKVAVPGDILPAATAVVLRASQADFTLTPSAASPVSVENNALRGTDVNMTVPSEHCYVLSGADGFVGFYPLSGSYTLTAHKAYIDLDNLPGGANNAPRRLRFVFSEEQTATGMENVQNEETKAQKVMIDGVMYIIRGEHMYDAQGQVIK
ncbi:MAG: InlB B-repeat-containing protein [Paludibacteraceae bacterium]|nr:InlB B-repeat-containing protein [Paludibacteraceae bacterium]